MQNLVRVLSAIIFFSPFFFSQTISWQQLSGPHGGNIYSLVADANGNLYANPTGDTQGLVGPFKSTDNGENWFSIKNGLAYIGTQFAPLNLNHNGDIFVIHSHDYHQFISLSTDGGNTWQETDLYNVIGGTSVICIAFDETDNVYIGTGQGIFNSTDNGDTWALFGNFTSGTNAIAFNDNGDIFVGAGIGYRSTDGGITWTPMNTNAGIGSIAINNSGDIFIGNNQNIERSTDNGDTWTIVKQGVNIHETSTILFDTNGDIYFPTWGNGVLRSTDNGDSWTEMNNNLGYKYVHSVVKDSDGNFFAGDNYGLYKSVNNCESWYSVGLPIAGVSNIIIPEDNNIYTAEWGINRSTDLGQSWQTINNGIDFLDITSLTENSLGYLFASAQRVGTFDPAGIYRSSNQGESWESVFSSNATMSLASGPNGEVVVVGTGLSNLIQISTDDGLTWTDISYGTGGAYLVAINSVGDIFITRNGGVQRKLANDTVWTTCTGSSGTFVLFIASNGYIYNDYTKSTDNGNTWISNNNPTFISSFTENSLGHLFIGTYNSGQGVYRSTDYAETWEQINTGLPIMDIRSVGVDDQDYLYAGSWGMSIFKTTFSTTDVEDIKYEPSTFYLEQNYPNPFNPSTKIKYSIPQSSNVTIRVFDILGKEIETLVNEEKPAGTYEVEFNSSTISGSISAKGGYASGVYFYQLKAGSFVETKKMILMK
jgi:photosystem II stability/assembly factor-like uncharacterized protein